MSVFDTNSSGKTYKEIKLFLDEGVTIARSDRSKYPVFSKLNLQQRGFFWVPEEIRLDQDRIDFHNLSEHEQHIFTSNIRRQILLDSVQGRAPVSAFTPICSQPEIESWTIYWTFSEQIHSESYAHLIRNVYNNPSVVLDKLKDIEEIVNCARDISYHYDRLIKMNAYRTLYDRSEDEYEHKKALWMALMVVNILEGVRFYVSFACSWAFAETGKMNGNAKIIKLICKDENLHLAGTQHILKTLVKDDPDFIKIAQETRDECIELFRSTANQEIEWANYLFKDGSMIGLNFDVLKNFVMFRTNKCMSALNLPPLYKSLDNPLPWTNKWIGGAEVQVRPQDEEGTMYSRGGIKSDVDKSLLSKLSL